EEQFELLDQADGILMGSPVYFGSVSGQLKAFWDLARACRSEQYLLDTVGGCLTVGASRYGGQETTLQTMRNMMLVQGMTIVGDGNSNTDAGHYGAASQQDAAEDEQAHQRAEILSRRVCKVAEATQSLR
ncbi:MAG: flavodoxin family protein, partial [Bacillota bacterium]